MGHGTSEHLSSPLIRSSLQVATLPVKELSFRRCRQHDHRTSAPKVRFPLLRLSGPTLGDIVKSCVSGTGASLLVPPARSSTINAPKSSGSSSQRSRDDLFRFFRPLITPLPLASSVLCFPLVPIASNSGYEHGRSSPSVDPVHQGNQRFRTPDGNETRRQLHDAEHVAPR